ncbi:hypothetical protein FC093_11275 [Ilyomonas limi]|uniref:Oligosaccharide repeat unit polymerase n=1 Tax=Ilyomonas limi TaxID=2575867 RepID=A0A4U3L077_9BACT|nr:hypothetical protein [Ilyomonas limi]TKK68210.1 hypothetical protein FC093_11275 [Ilyomonas limi]
MESSISYTTLSKKSDLTFILITTAPGWLLASIFNSIAIADLNSIWASFIVVLWIGKQVGRPFEMIRFVRITAAVLCAIQNISWIMASFIHKFYLDESIEETLYHSMSGGLTFQSYALAIFYITAFSIAISFLGYKKKIFLLENSITKAILILKKYPFVKLRLLLVGFSLINILLIITGVIGQRSTIIEGYENGERAFWIVLYESLLPAQVLLCGLFLWNLINSKKSKINWGILLFSTLVLLFIFFTKDRRSFIFSVFGIGFWFYFFSGKGIKVFKVALIIAIIYPFLSKALLFNNFIRSANGITGAQPVSAVELVPEAWEKFNSSEGFIEEEEENTTENLSERPLVATPLALCLQYPVEKKTFTLGENLINSFVWSIPGPIISNKREFPVQEDLLYAHFAISRGDLEDTADSLYLSSYTEFSWFGFLIYPILLVVLWRLVLSLLKSWNIQGISLIICVSIFFQSFLLNIGEGSTIAWFVALRSFLFWAILYKSYNYFIKKSNYPKPFYYKR